MKKVIIFSLLLISIKGLAQNHVDSTFHEIDVSVINLNTKVYKLNRTKNCLIMSGITLAGGAIVSLVMSNMKAPNINDFTVSGISGYETAYKDYDKKQKALSNISNSLYLISGLSIVFGIAFNF